MVHFTIIHWFIRSGVWICNWFIVKFNWKIWSVDLNITIINGMMIKSPHDSLNHRASVGSRGPGFEVSCYRLAVLLSWWFIWFIPMKGVELIHISSKTWWEEFWTMDDSGIRFVSNTSLSFLNNFRYHAKIFNNWPEGFYISVGGIFRTTILRLH